MNDKIEHFKTFLLGLAIGGIFGIELILLLLVASHGG